jgi:hypothetical protein
MPDDMVGLSFVGWVEGGQLSKPLVRQVFDYGDDLLGFVRVFFAWYGLSNPAVALKQSSQRYSSSAFFRKISVAMASSSSADPAT